MTEYVCTCDAMCVESKRERVAANPKDKTVIWNALWQLIETIGAFAVEIYCWNYDAQPHFSNGGTRVLIRPDRIDLV